MRGEVIPRSQMFSCLSPEARGSAVWRAGLDDCVEPIAEGTIRLRKCGEFREHGAFPVRFVRVPARGSTAFISWRRSRIASRSSSVNPLGFLPFVAMLLPDLCVPFVAGVTGAFPSNWHPLVMLTA
jgi:hypothetical protein